MVTERMSAFISSDNQRVIPFLVVDAAPEVFVSSVLAIPVQVVTGVPGTSQDKQQRLLAEDSLPDTAYHVQDWSGTDNDAARHSLHEF
jgi:hypothetical protein